MTAINLEQLVEAACTVRGRAYAPYSKYLVGAALQTSDGEIITGCNVENISYGLTNCAERVAIGTAVAAGKTSFDALVIATANGGTPCGACRQVLAEFCRDLPVYLVAVDDNRSVTELSLARLLPGRFDFS